MSAVKLTRLLETHRSFSSENGLENNFGDLYLIKKNRIFSHIRHQALAANFGYSNERNDNYNALPLSQLENVLKTKTIPYLDNISVLDKLAADTQITWEDIRDNLRKNYVFHESCHAVARSLMSAIYTHELSQEKVLQILIEESFANTCEFMAVIDATDPIHRIFYEWNSYTSLFEERTHLERATKEMGDVAVFKFLLLSYLQANFLKTELSDKNLNRMINLSFENSLSDTRQLKTLRYLARITFTLDQRFREITTGFHLRLCGFQKSLSELLNFNALDMIENEKSYPEFMTAVASAALRGSSSSHRK